MPACQQTRGHLLRHTQPVAEAASKRFRAREAQGRFPIWSADLTRPLRWRGGKIKSCRSSLTCQKTQMFVQTACLVVAWAPAENQQAFVPAMARFDLPPSHISSGRRAQKPPSKLADG